MKRKQKHLGRKQIVRIVAGAIALIAVGITGHWAWDVYSVQFMSNTAFPGPEYTVLIPRGTDLDGLLALMRREEVLRSPRAFRRFAKTLGGARRSYSGRYVLRQGQNTLSIFTRIAGHMQDPVALVVPSTRTLEEFSGRVARQLSVDSMALLGALRDPEVCQELGFTPETIWAMCLPNTYEVYWDCTLDQLLERLKREWERYWTPARDSLAQDVGLSRVETYTLASIIQEEAVQRSELPRIAGVYMNRLRIGMALQADPTCKFAVGDMSISRVRTWHTQFESPYNTYLYPGLPPGPIRITDLSCLEAVLSYERHKYLYFVAREDFSGFHHFSRTLPEHAAHARAYKRALARLKKD